MKKINNVRRFYFDYQNYTWPKCPYYTYYQRIRKGFDFETSINPKSMQFKWKITEQWRVCSRCWKFKVWGEFNKDKTWTNHKVPYCKDCWIKYKAIFRSNEENKKRENEHKKEYRATERWKLIIKLDNIYYNDPQILNNRQILKKFHKPAELRKKANEDKFFYFLNKGYDEKLLIDLYKFKYKPILWYND